MEVNVFKLEKDLIYPDEWDNLYCVMPIQCKKVVDVMKIFPDCVGIGRNEKIGWFIMGSGLKKQKIY